MVRPGLTWQGEVMQARTGEARSGLARQCRQGMARRGVAWLGKDGHGNATFDCVLSECLSVLVSQPPQPRESLNMATKKAEQTEVIAISAPKFDIATISIVGTSPYMQARFSEKAMGQMMDKMAGGSTSKKGKAREARDFDADYKNAMHISTDGWNGIPASAFRNACISACRIVGFKMTLAKLSIFVEADGLDKVDGTPLVKLFGEAERTDMIARNSTGVCDIRVRPMWREWNCSIRVRFDADQFRIADVVNLISRAGCQVGIGEGRPDSRMSCGLGLGMFKVDRVDSVITATR